MQTRAIRILSSKIPVAIVLGGCAWAMQAMAVQAPPLPPGSTMVRVEAGLSPDEDNRQKRAHKHSELEKKDPTRDDTLDTPAKPKDPKRPKNPQNQTIPASR